MLVSFRFWLVLVARVLQGVGSGIATPLMMNIILEQSPRAKIGKLMGVGSLVITVAPAIGPTVGGAVAAAFPWRWVFAIVAVIILAISLPLGLKNIRQTRPVEAAELNGLQFVMVVVALAGLLFGVNQLGVGVCSVGIALLFVFSAHLTPFTLAAFFFLFGVGYALCISNIMTSGMAGIPGPFIPDGNAVFNTVMPFGGAAGMTLFSTIMAVAQAGHGSLGQPSFVAASTRGGTWIFGCMLIVFLIAFACLCAAFRMRADRAAKQAE
ncbi:putative MFS drug:H+ antiporter [Bifidobacterium magnum]|uniref:Putative MFS drug:H+ antiporter n=2 Tax=Bifidobacterium magnum TaxID=1692 RepID=A0A087BCX1_9BIFI|nr:putative MFS drug:H+ antiporter [Bifidobacterium magnum]